MQLSKSPGLSCCDPATRDAKGTCSSQQHVQRAASSPAQINDLQLQNDIASPARRLSATIPISWEILSMLYMRLQHTHLSRAYSCRGLQGLRMSVFAYQHWPAAELTMSTRGAAMSSDHRMVVSTLSLRWMGGRIQMEKMIMTGPEVMSGTASRFAGSSRPPSSIGADAYKGKNFIQHKL